MLDLRLFDVYSDRFYFTVEKNEKFKTNIGGLFGIIGFLLIISMSFFLGKNFYFKLDPRILEQRKALHDHVIREIDPFDITVAWKIENYNGTSLNIDGVLFLNVFEEVWQDTSQDEYKLIKKRRLNSSRCNDTKFNNIELKGIKKEKWYCIDIDGVDGLYLGGKIHESDVEYSISLSISNCPTEKYDKNVCSSFKQLGERSPYVTVLHPSVDFNYDLSDPLTVWYSSYSNTLDPLLANSYSCNYNYGNFTDDQGLFTQNFINQEFIYIDNCIVDISSLDRGQDEREPVNYWSKVLHLSKTISENRRSYMKIQDLFAILGGFISALNIIFKNIYQFFFIFERKKFFIDKIWLENENSKYELKNLNDKLKDNFDLKNKQMDLNSFRNISDRNYFLKNQSEKRQTNSDVEKYKLNTKNSKNEGIQSKKVKNFINDNNDNSKIKLELNISSDLNPNINIDKIERAEPDQQIEKKLEDINFVDRKNLFTKGFYFLLEFYEDKTPSKEIRSNFKNYGFCRHSYSTLFKKDRNKKTDNFEKIINIYEHILEEPYDAYNYFKFYYRVNYNFVE